MFDERLYDIIYNEQRDNKDLQEVYKQLVDKSQQVYQSIDPDNFEQDEDMDELLDEAIDETVDLLLQLKEMLAMYQGEVIVGAAPVPLIANEMLINEFMLNEIEENQLQNLPVYEIESLEEHQIEPSRLFIEKETG